MFPTLFGILFIILFLILLIRLVGQTTGSRAIDAKQENQSAWPLDFHSNRKDYSDGGDGEGE